LGPTRVARLLIFEFGSAEELLLNFGDGLAVRRRRLWADGQWFGDDLDPVVECLTENEFWQLVVAIETTPAFLRGLEQFEDHRERRPVGQAPLRSDRAVAHGGDGAFNGIGRPQVFVEMRCASCRSGGLITVTPDQNDHVEG
jgi:hypothetical protein